MKPLKETVLLYDGGQRELNRLYEEFSRKNGIDFRPVPREHYHMPLGLAAFGEKEDQEEYLRKGEGKTFEGTMMVLAGFTRERLSRVLAMMREDRLPTIPLKAILTEHNAVWDSVYLHEHLLQEHAAMMQRRQNDE